MGWAAVAQIAATAYASNQAQGAADDAFNAQKNAAEAARTAFGNIPVPTVQEQSIILQNPQLMGQYTPEQQQAMKLNVSAMQGVHADQSTVDAQNSALKGLGEVAQGGFTEGDKAAARDIQDQTNQEGQARQKAILNAMASRGVLGSGMELAAKLQGDQTSADQAGKASNNLIQQAQARSLQALSQQGNLGTTMNAQQFGQQSDKARAADSINQFNVQNAQATSNANVNEKNKAQMANLQQRQTLENTRAQNANQQDMYNKQLLQTQFANKTGQAVNMNAANQAAANAASAQANSNAARIQGIGSAVVGGIGAYAANNSANSQAQANRDSAEKIAAIKAGTSGDGSNFSDY